MNSQLNYHPANPDDLELILSLMQEFYAEDQIAFDIGRARRSVAELLARPELGSILLLSEQGTPDGHGILVLILSFTLEHGGLFVLLDELYLQPSLRGRGLGKKAIQLARRWAVDKGAHAMRLEVHHHNPEAKALYGKHGFEDDHRDVLTLWL